MKALALLAALAGCGAESPPPETIPAPVHNAATVDNSDDLFRADVRAWAAAHAMTVTVWGTSHLDKTDAALHFASLDVELEDATTPKNKGGTGFGAYILEQAPGRYWVVGHWWYSSGLREGIDDPPGEPTWHVLDATTLRHKHLHNHGQADVEFGFRGGRLRAINSSDSNSRATPDYTEDKHEDDASCATACPLLDSNGEMPVFGPMSTIAALPVPHSDHM